MSGSLRSVAERASALQGTSLMRKMNAPSILAGMISPLCLANAAYADGNGFQDDTDNVAMSSSIQETAHNPFSGHIESYFGGLNISTLVDVEKGRVYGGSARGNYRFGQRWNIQGDMLLDGISTDDDDFRAYGGALHIYWRDASSFALGAFATTDRLGIGGVSYGARWTVGPEAQVYFGNATAYAQVYFGEMTNNTEEINLWGARGVVRYFATDNLRFDSELGYRTLELDPGSSIDTVSVAAQASYRFTNSPLTVFGRYQFDNLSVVSQDAELHKFVVGLRATFSEKTLLAEDREGATMETHRVNFIFY